MFRECILLTVLSYTGVHTGSYNKLVKAKTTMKLSNNVDTNRYLMKEFFAEFISG